ncbi:MAG: GDSL-type esterase/lipase family protein [Bacteroidaceae bacterium]|nr:GDSL-type esterase/lipase family protein [Bacteroidaceae bacterium]
MKMILLVLILSFLPFQNIGAQSIENDETIIKPTDKNIQYIGRIGGNPERPMFTYPGVQIRSGFTGTTLKMLVKPNSGYFMVQIDENEAFKVGFYNKTDSIAELASQLPDTHHQVIITHIGEGYERLPEFRGFIVDKGKELTSATPLPSRKIEFIGNSITCGYGIETDSPTDPYLEETANYYYTYAAQTARNLNAQALVVARSGIGVYRNYNGPQTGDIVNMNTEYPYTFLYNDQHRWDFSRYTPDVVCINLGTNDTSTQGADSLLLIEGFKKLYRQVRNHYPKAKIIFLCGCMMAGKALLDAQQAMDATTNYAHKQGDSEVYRLDFKPHDGTLGYGASYHPSMRQHEKMANELTAFLRKLMKW